MAARRRRSFVAVVEDDVGVRTAILGLLQSCDIVARGFASAEQFLQFPQHSRAACLILDMRLPGMTGLQLSHALLSDGLHIPTIFITAENDPDGRLRQQLLQAGALEVLGKPFDTERLLALTEAALGRRG
jgi:FixJ family two-component response regulator